MVLYQHDRDFLIKVDGEDLMLSSQHESELELARLGCAHLVEHKAPSILLGGLGMGYTLRQALEMLSPHTEVVVSELLDDVIGWNHEFLGKLNNHPLKDERVDLRAGNIVELISRSRNRFDAILLDIDNGPGAFSYSGNSRLYGHKGIWACRRALRKNGCLAVWSAGPCRAYERLLLHCGFHVRRYHAPAFKGAKSLARLIWVAAADSSVLPPGGREPRRHKSMVRKGRGPAK